MGGAKAGVCPGNLYPRHGIAVALKERATRGYPGGFDRSIGAVAAQAQVVLGGARPAPGPSPRHGRCPRDQAPPVRTGICLFVGGRASDSRPVGGAPARLARGAAGLSRRALRRGSMRPSSGRGPRRRRPAAIPLSPGMGEGEGGSQGATPGALGRGAAAHPAQRRPISCGRGSHSRVRARGGDRAGGAERHPAGRRELRAPQRHARRRHLVQVQCRDFRGNDHARVSLERRQGGPQGVRRGAPVCGDRAVAPAAGPAPVSIPRRRRDGAAGAGARGQPVPAGPRRRAHLAQGLSHLVRIGLRARHAGANVSGGERTGAPQAGVRGGARRGGELHNSPAICRKSYVHETVVSAFENGVLERFSATLRSCRSPARKERFLAEIVAASVL